MVVHKSGQCLVNQGQHLQGCLLIRRTACQNAIHDSDRALVCHQSRVGAIEVSYVVGTFTSGKGMHIATECNLSPKHWMMACRMTWSRSRSHNPSSVSNMKVEIGPYEEVTCMSRHAQRENREARLTSVSSHIKSSTSEKAKAPFSCRPGRCKTVSRLTRSLQPDGI